MDEFKIEAVQKHSPGAAAAAAKLAKGCVGVMAGSLLLSSCITTGIPYTPLVNVQITTDNQDPIAGLKVTPSWEGDAQRTNENGYVSFFDNSQVRQGSITITDVDGEKNGSYEEKVFDIPDEGEFHIVTMEEATTDEQ